MIAAFKVACQEKRKRQVMKRELDGLKEEFTKLKGMVHLTVALLNLQNHGVPTEDIQDIFNSQIMEESSEEEEIPQENVVAIPIPGLSVGILQMLQEILLSPSPSLCQRAYFRVHFKLYPSHRKPSFIHKSIHDTRTNSFHCKRRI